VEAKQIEIECPCCKSRLLVDVRTGQLLRSRRPEELDSEGRPVVSERDWDEALGRVKDRSQTREGRLDEALNRERDKASRLDDLFRQARDKLGSREERDEP
jgi:hypothetical protein